TIFASLFFSPFSVTGVLALSLSCAGACRLRSAKVRSSPVGIRSLRIMVTSPSIKYARCVGRTGENIDYVLESWLFRNALPREPEESEVFRKPETLWWVACNGVNGSSVFVDVTACRREQLRCLSPPAEKGCLVQQTCAAEKAVSRQNGKSHPPILGETAY